MYDADEAEATRAQREQIDERIVQLDDALRACDATVQQLQLQLRCHDLDVEAAQLQRRVAVLRRESTDAPTAATVASDDAVALRRATLMCALDDATRQRDALRRQKGEYEQRVLRQALCLVQRVLRETHERAATRQWGSDTADGATPLRVQLLCQLSSAVQHALMQQLPLHSMSRHSINFYCRLPHDAPTACSDEDDDSNRNHHVVVVVDTDGDEDKGCADAATFTGLALRHCRPPHATRMRVCLGRMHTTDDAVRFVPDSRAVTLCEVDGVVYDGHVDARGERDGDGTGTFVDGTRYTGTWQGGKRHGRGVHSRVNGDRYDGAFVHDRADSEASTLYLANGDVYRGAFVDGQRHGHGTLRRVCGECYDGMWCDDRRHGAGTCHYADGQCYEGEWRDDKRHGDGCVRDCASGGCYRGGWADDVKHGGGAVHFDGGVRYDGTWRHGTRRGQASAFTTSHTATAASADNDNNSGSSSSDSAQSSPPPCRDTPAEAPAVCVA